DLLRGRALGVELLAVRQRLRRLLELADLHPDGAIRHLAQGLAHELAVALVLDRLGQRAREQLLAVASLVLLEQVEDVVELAELVVAEALPDLADPVVALRLRAAPVVVDL